MTFAPIISGSGYAGWAFLKRTMSSQQAAFNKSPEIKRDADYFRAKIASIKTADQLVSDRRLLKVALGAFGLDNDIDSKAFIKKVLTDGTLKTGALANKLADKQYQKFSAAFGFGDFTTPRTQLSDFADQIINAYQARQFETAVGAQDDDLRLALNAERELSTLAAKTSSENSKWFTVMGSTPLRRVFEMALGLPKSLASLDIDQQLSVFKDKAEANFGADTISQFKDPAVREKLVRRFTVRAQAEAMASQSGGGAAVMMLQQSVALARQRR